jgi:hypothetical protein
MNNWQESYAKLRAYVATHPEIEITPTVTSIPADVRAEFYRLFDSIRTDYVKTLIQSQLQDATQLGREYYKVKAAFVDRYKVQVEIPPILEWFLQDPVDGLARRIFAPLFDLTSGKTDVTRFDEDASKIVQDSLKDFTARAYKHWVTLSLLRLLKPERTFSVPVHDERTEPDLSQASIRHGRFRLDIPALEKVEKLELDSSEYIPLLVPKMIVQSGAVGSYVALRTPFHRVYFAAIDLHDHIKGGEWQPIVDLEYKFGKLRLWPDIGLYTDTDPDNLRIMMDLDEVMRPDVTVEVMEAVDWYQGDGVDAVKRHFALMHPRLGDFIVCRKPLHPTQQGGTEGTQATTVTDVRSQIPPVIQVLEVGYDSAKLGPIIEALTKAGHRA